MTAYVQEEEHCSKCYFSKRVTDAAGRAMLECRRFPPQLQLVSSPPQMIPPKIVGQQPQLVGGQIMKQSGFPNCEDACGEFKAQPVDFANTPLGEAH